MLISPAYAQAAAPAAGGDMFMSLLPLLMVFVVFYFLLIRPQQTKMKLHRTMIENLKKGDQIVTAGGVVGQGRARSSRATICSWSRSRPTSRSRSSATPWPTC